MHNSKASSSWEISIKVLENKNLVAESELSFSESSTPLVVRGF